ncbi:MAG: ammonia-forming cytochrome c nitrite reductase subunit c552 [Fidelibacterota bacterium]
MTSHRTLWHAVNRRLPVLLAGSFLFMSVVLGTLGCEKTEEPEEVIAVDEIIALEDGTVIPQGTSVTTGITLSLTATVTTTGEAGDVVLYWHAEEGKLSSDLGDTVVWKAPDDEGTFAVTVHASDGTYIGVGVRPFGVGAYTPTVTPYYLGGETCAQCHTKEPAGWAETGHAGAWAALQASDHAAPYCNKCHTVDQYEVAGNAGYDDVPIATFENVQCENCHGPGSDHKSSLNKADITVSFDAAVCGSCHTGDHNPTYDEWSESHHNNEDAFQWGISSCQGCHEGVAAAIRLSGDLSTYYNGGDVGRPDTSERALSPISCAACHDPHDATNDHQLRTVADVVLVEANGESPVITDGGKGKLCMQCHHARRSAESQLDEGYAHFGPHGNPQGDMLAASSAYEGVAETGFPWAAPTHLYIEDACVTCHMHMEEYISEDEPAVTGHSYEPTVEACAQCHGTISDFGDIMARDDFDGDGEVEGVHDEVEGLMHLLEEALVDAGLDTTGGADFEEALGDTTRSTYQLRQAGYNLVFVEADKSHGIHNPDYAIQLLQQSYKHLTGSLPLNSVPHYGDRRVVENW